MKIEVKEKKKNPLLKREEVTIRIDHTGKATPSRPQIIGEVSRLLESAPENLIISRIITMGGSPVTEAKVLSYSRKEDIPQWMSKKMLNRISKVKGHAKPREDASGNPEPAAEAEQVV